MTERLLKIKELRELSGNPRLADCKDALEATGWNVQAAIPVAQMLKRRTQGIDTGDPHHLCGSGCEVHGNEFDPWLPIDWERAANAILPRSCHGESSQWRADLIKKLAWRFASLKLAIMAEATTEARIAQANVLRSQVIPWGKPFEAETRRPGVNDLLSQLSPGCYVQWERFQNSGGDFCSTVRFTCLTHVLFGVSETYGRAERKEAEQEYEALSRLVEAHADQHLQ